MQRLQWRSQWMSPPNNKRGAARWRICGPLVQGQATIRLCKAGTEVHSLTFQLQHVLPTTRHLSRVLLEAPWVHAYRKLFGMRVQSMVCLVTL